MYSRERAERIIVEAMRKAVNIGFKPVALGNAHIGIRARQGGFSAGLSRQSPVTVNMFDEGALKTAQLDMLQELFRRYGADYSPTEATTMLSALVGGSLTRYAKAFAKSLPIIGSFLCDEAYSVPVVAAACTYALGQVAVLRLEMEQSFTRLNFSAVKYVYRQEFERGKVLSRTLEQGQSNAALVLDFDSAPKWYEQACQKPSILEKDPFAISIEEMPPFSAQTTSSNEPASLVERFEQLAALRANGVLTDEEFQAQKQQLLNQL